MYEGVIELKIINKHKIEVENRGYYYIGTYEKGDYTLDKNKLIKANCLYIRVKCPYCGKIYDTERNGFINKKYDCRYCCNKYENSLAYHIQQELQLKLCDVWDFEKNIVNPYFIYKNYNGKVWIKCQEKEYHGSYQTKCYHFYEGNGCPYCKGKKVHIDDSFAIVYPKKLKYWSDKNKISPYNISKKSSKEIWFICDNCGKVFKRRLSNLANSNCGVKCLNCISSKGEKRIKNYLDEYNIKYISQKTFNNLVGINNGNLSYDFYLPDYNLLIEYQGEQHEHFVKGFQKSIEDFKKQQEHDKRKRQYAMDNNIELLEIWYWDYDNIENILSNKINLKR